MRRSSLALLAAPLGLLAAVPAADALTFRACGRPAIRCATVAVPLDRSGGAPGTIALHVERVAATRRATSPPLFALAGGPGDRATAVTLRYANRLAQGRSDRDLIVFDQRGLGRSGAITCAGIEAQLPAQTALPACAAQLGGARASYTSVDSAEDIEAIRAALGAPKIALFGNSYGSWVAQVYARRHPGQVDRLVLDSSVPPGELADQLDERVYRRLPELLRALCTGGTCRGLTTDLARDAYGLLDRLGTAPLKARWIDENGRAQRTSLNRIGLLSALADLDLRPNLRAEIPRAVSAARRGDGALLARLVAAQAAASDGKPSINNATVNRVTQCEEVPFPWDRSAAPAERLAQARARLAATPESALAPVGRELAFLTSLLPTCAYWPSRPAPPDFGGPLPPVPALVLAGEADLRTPLESAEELRNSLPGSQLLLVPNAGHASLQGDTTGCARRAVGAFLGGGRAAACSTRPDPYVPRPLPPRSLRAAGGPVAAVLLTVDDALDQTDAGMFGLDGRERGGGLRGGTFQRSGGRLVLRAYELVAGVKVTGTVPTAGPARLRLGGAASGTLVFAPGGAVTGSLGGRPVHARARLERRTVTERVDARFGTPPVSVLGRAG